MSTAPHEGPAPLVSVIVPCRGHAEVLGRCLASLAHQDLPHAYEIVVVDSASDEAVARVARATPHARLVRSDVALLPGEARNLGVAHAAGEHVAFIDADCIAEPGWLSGAVEGLQGEARLVGGPVLDALPLHPIAISDNLLHLADFSARRPKGPARYFPGCNLAIRRRDFHAVGGFRHSGDVAGEDTMFCNDALSLWPEGLWFIPTMRVHHRGRTRLREYLGHQHGFGHARGVLGLHLNTEQKRYGRHAAMILPVAVKRLSYIVKRNAVWGAGSLIRTTLLLPLLLPGLVAWAVGFRRGLLDAEPVEAEARP